MIRIGTIEDVYVINRIFTTPEVLSFHANNPELEYDFTRALQEDNCIFLINDTNDAMSMWEPIPGNYYEGHSMFTNTCRGRRGLETGKAMMRFLYDELNVRKAIGHTPISNLAARKFSRMLGFKSEGFKTSSVGIVEMFVYDWNNLSK